MNQIANLHSVQSGLDASTSLRRAAFKAPSGNSIHPSLPRRFPRRLPFGALSKRPSNQRPPFRNASSAQQDPDSGLFYPSSSSRTADSDDLDDDEEPDAAFKNTPDFFSDSTSTISNGGTSTSLESSHSTEKVEKILEEKEEEEEGDILIEFKDVHKSFGSKKILRGASFKIRRGEAVGIIGSSGTGKSTTLRLAAGLLQPDSGEVLVKGEARKGLLSDDDTSDKLKVGLVFQSGALFDSLTVKENVGFMLYEHSDLSDERIEAAVASSLAKVGLSGVENFYPSELSGGMKKRVALARAIVSDTQGIENGEADTSGAEQLIMYDEPTAGLDPVASTVIEDLIRNMHDKPSTSSNNSHSNDKHGENGHLNGNSTKNDGGEDASHNGNSLDSNNHIVHNGGGGITSYVVVTHQHSTIRRAVDKIIFLHDGKVVWEGSVEEFDTTEEPIVRQFASGSLKGPIVYE